MVRSPPIVMGTTHHLKIVLVTSIQQRSQFADLKPHFIEVEVFQIILSVNIPLIKLQELSDALE